MAILLEKKTMNNIVKFTLFQVLNIEHVKWDISRSFITEYS